MARVNSSEHLVIRTDHDADLEPTDLEALRHLGVEVVTVCTEEEFLAVADRAVAVLNSDFRLTAKLIESLSQCRVISRYGSGVDNIDVQAATREGIPVANVPLFCVEEVANRALTLLLACSCQLLQLDCFTRNGKWGESNLPYAAQIEGRVLGLIGYGRIGRAVARRAKAFGLKVIAYDPYLSQDVMQSDDVTPSEIDDLLAVADYVSIHSPLTNETYHLIDERRLNLMKASAILINTARGSLIDEPALIRVLTERKIGGAGLDVFEKEPPDKNNPLFFLHNVILTPHCASHTELASQKVRPAAVDAVVRVLRGGYPTHVVNPEVLKWVA